MNQLIHGTQQVTLLLNQGYISEEQAALIYDEFEAYAEGEEIL